MLEQILKTLVDEKKRLGLSSPVIKNILKGVLQMYVLDYLYNSPYSQKLIFTGGSALRICFGLNRLSEDLDFDLIEGQKIDKQNLANEITLYFKEKLAFPTVYVAIKGQSKKIYLKFPILFNLNLAKYPETDLLYVKVEIAPSISKFGQTEIIPISQYTLNFLIKSYDLNTLFANKIIAVVKRTFVKGKNQQATFKGRDYFDLLWFFQKGIVPDWQRLSSVIEVTTEQELNNMLLDKIKNLHLAYLKEDLLPLFEDNRFVENYVKNYNVMAEKYLR